MRELGQRPALPGDFDGDADVDLLVEVLSASRSAVPAPGAPGHSRNPLALMALLRNDGTGALTQAALAADPGVTFAVDGREAEDSFVLDADQDGDLDLFTHTQELSGATRMWGNDGTGRFRAGGSFPERAVWAGDVDLDGDLDLMTNGGDYGGASSRMLLYLGENAVPGRLPDLVQDTRTGGWPIDTAISVGDFNLDGYPDFALITPGSFYEVLAFNNVFPQGSTLVANVTLASPYSLGEDQRVDLGDLDGDGLIDALVGPHDGELTDISELYHKRGPTYANNGAFDPFVQQLVPAGLLVDLDTDDDLDVLGSRIVFNRTVP